MLGDVDADQALAVGEAVEARGCSPRDAAARSARGPGRAAGRAARGTRGSGRAGSSRAVPARGRAARRREVLEVGAVGAQRRRREAALHAEVGEEVVDRPVEVGRGRHVSPTRRGPSATPPPDRAARAPTPAPSRAPPPSIAASSSMRPVSSRGWTSVTVRPSRSRFSIRKWASAWAAIPGRWVTHRTWWRRASAQRLRPIGSALRPPMPVSTSSKTSVGVSSTSARTCLIASATRLISPPEAILASGRGGSPEFGASMNTTRSTPLASNASASPSSSTAGSSSSAGSPPQGDVEHAVREAERHEHGPDVVGERPCRRRPGDRQCRRGERHLAPGAARPRRRRASRSVSSPRSRSASARARSPWAITAASSSP